ncbi:acyltransferase family protein [Fluviispira multicolorata]|uniref:acyltransferase family protein n=1 Tax=Fluviispira multicolorata TaxID=2654512 RepID=UPI00137593ED|nr:acyltransferase family protein [Fluviispira multicolorata]
MNNINKLLYRPDIDGLRAVAVFFVVIYHLFPSKIPGGFIGVDIFFVISGFLISTNIFKNLDNNTFLISDFYMRRVLRIFPALILVIMTTLLLGWLILFEREFVYLGKHIAGGIGFVSNELQWRESVDYFNSGLRPLLNLWSLGVEEQFYLLWPFIAIVSWKFKRNFLKIMILLFLISFITNIILLYLFEMISESYLMTVSRFWELAAGGILGYLTLYKRNESSERINNIKSIFGIILLILSVFLINSDKMFPGFWALMPVIGAYLIISSGRKPIVNRYFLSNKYIVYIGLISYPIYLWHWPLIVFNKYLFPNPSAFLNLICVLILTLLLSVLTFYFVENPIKKVNKKTAVYSLISVSILLVIIGVGGYKGKIKPYSSQFELQSYNDAVKDWDYPPKFLHKSFYNGSSLNQNGVYKDKILFMGDSNIEQYAPRIEKILIDNPSIKKSTIFFTGSGCYPIKNVKIRGKLSCQKYLQDVYDYAEDPQVQTVVIGSEWLGYLKEDVKAYYENEHFIGFLRKSPVAVDKMLNEFELSLKRLVDLKKSVYVILNIPRGEVLSPLHMINRSIFNDRFSINIQNVSKVDIINSKNSFLKRLKNVVIEAGAQVIDPLDYLCGKDSICPSTYENKPIYKDAGHLRASFVREHITYLDFLILQK